MTTRFCFPAALLLGALLGGTSVAAPPDIASDNGVLLLQAAQRQADDLEARYRAGVATQDEREQAQTALSLAKVRVRLQEAESLLELQQQMVKAGVLPQVELLTNRLVIADCTVAAKQIVVDQRQRMVNRTNELLRAGIISRAEADTAAVALENARLDLEQAKMRYREQKLACLRQRVLQAEQRMKAGIGSQADVQNAQAEYDTARRP